jgi:methenyltetrahydromethanopterin cyclohydrolase
MDTEIIEQVVISIEAWKEYEKIGEEVRAMEETISKEAENNIDPVMDFLLEVIRKYDDYDLGKILRGVYIPLKLIIDDSENT